MKLTNQVKNLNFYKKLYISICLILISGVMYAANTEEFNSEKFAIDYFNAWTASQSPTATKENIEHYLSFLTDNVGHQHLPYDPDASRNEDGKKNIRKGMHYYLGGHSEYLGQLVSFTDGHDVIVIKYQTSSKGIHPQTKQVIAQKYLTLEVLEIEKGKVSVIRKYSE